MAGHAAAQSAGWRVEREADATVLHLPGRLDDHAVADCWDNALTAVRGADRSVTVECSGVEECGGAGFALLLAIEQESRKCNLPCRFEGLAERFRSMFDAVDRAGLAAAPAGADNPTRIEDLGRAAAERASDWRNEGAFIGEVTACLFSLGRRPRLRWREWWVIVEKAGTDALPIVALISFLVGMIMAFQGAMPMRQFGVDLFVVNLVALAVTRELGPIMTAIALAGRSGSAFAAEIGTMKVNEEVAALTTMGLSPVRFLAVPRVLAGIAVTPVLTVYSMAIGVAGGLLVMLMLGFPLSTLFHQLRGAIELRDVMAGLLKSFFFGAVIAGVGCMRGLQTGAGPSAVGDSTTRSVVTGIFLVVLLDAVFAVVYYQLKF